MPKLGVVALLTRVMNPGPRMKAFLWIFVGGSTIFIFGCVIIMFAQCRPTRALWTPTLTGATCWSPAVLEDYSFASGGMCSRWKQHGVRKIDVTSAIGICRSVSRCVSGDGSMEAEYESQEEDWPDVYVGPGRLVSISTGRVWAFPLTSTAPAQCLSTSRPV